MYKVIIFLVILNCFMVCAEGDVLFSISSEPSNAKVFIDGIATHHNTPTDEIEQKDVIGLWTPGKHSLKLTKSGYLLEQEIEIVEGERLILDLIIPEINEGPVDSSSEESEECEPCPKCSDELKIVEKIVYKENTSCEPLIIEKVINDTKECIKYESKEYEGVKYGFYFLCFIVILLVIGYGWRNYS